VTHTWWWATLARVSPIMAFLFAIALLWRERCRARGVRVRALGFAAAGVVGVPALVLATTGALWLTR
jgi:hypothetical protein